MTHKSCVKDFLEYLAQHEDEIIITEKHTYTNSTLRESIINCLNQAMEDGYKKGHIEAEANALYDVTIGGHKDW